MALRIPTGDYGMGDVEDGLDRLLDSIDSAIDDYSEMFVEEDPLYQLAAAEAWISLASHAVAAVYAPASPFKQLGRAGWRASVISRLRRIAAKLSTSLIAAGQQIQADSVAVGVQFPWGLSVEIGWDV